MKKLLTPKVLLLAMVLIMALLMVTVMFITLAQFKTVKVIAGEGGRVFGGGDFNAEQTVEINAIPDDGFRFKAWYKTASGEEDLFTTSAHYVFKMPNQNIELTAVFEPIPKRTLIIENVLLNAACEIIQIDDVKSTETTGGGEKLEDANVTIKAIVEGDYTFIGWFFEDLLLSNDAEITFVMQRTDITVKAYFMKGKVTLHKLIVEVESLKPSDTVKKHVSALGGYSSKDHSYPAGWIIELLAVPNTSSDDVAWEYDDKFSFVENGNKIEIIMPDEDLTVRAKFSTK